MTARQEPRRVQAHRLQAAFRAHLDQQAQRDRAAFDAALADLLDRIAARPPPPVSAPTDPPRPVPPTAPAPRRSPARPTPITSFDAVPPPLIQPAPPEVWWSPTPVLGYRMWELRDGGLHGAWTRWSIPRKTAVCLDTQTRATGPVPHDASECRHPPCGIYTLKDPDSVARAAARELRHSRPSLTVAIGLVAMAGRVIEHARGYRAEHVEVVALAMVTGASGKSSVLVTIDDTEEVLEAFTNPSRVRSARDPRPCPLDDAIERAVTHLRGRAALFGAA